MRYYDIVAMEGVGEGLSRSLGFERVFSAKDIRVIDRPSGNSAYLLRSSEPGSIFRALGDRNCLGVIFKDNVPVKKTLEKVASSEKPVVIPITELTCASGASFMRNTYRLRSVLEACEKAGVDAAIVSLASSDSDVLSALQMLELARFIGAGDAKAKAMVSHRWRA